MARSALIISLLLATPTSAYASWVKATGSYIFPPVMSEAEACQQADSRARADAVRQVSGETLSSEEAMRCTEQGNEADCSRNLTVWTMVGGEIRSTRNLRTLSSVEADSIRKCTVSFDADVHIAGGKPDPSFDIGVVLNNVVYRDGENLSITLKPSKSMFVQIFQWLPYEQSEGQVSRLFPNQFDSVERITHDVTIPSEAGAKRYDLRIGFPASLAAGRKMVDEYLMVVATKTPVAFRESYSLDDFNRVISEIPLGDRRIIRRLYNVVRGRE